MLFIVINAKFCSVDHGAISFIVASDQVIKESNLLYFDMLYSLIHGGFHNSLQLSLPLVYQQAVSFFPNTLHRECVFNAHSSWGTAWRAFRPAWVQIHISPAGLWWKCLLQSLSWSEELQPLRTHFARLSEAPFLEGSDRIHMVWVWIPPSQAPRTEESWPVWTETFCWRSWVRWAVRPCLCCEFLIHACWWTRTFCPLLVPDPSSTWTTHPWCHSVFSFQRRKPVENKRYLTHCSDWQTAPDVATNDWAVELLLQTDVYPCRYEWMQFDNHQESSTKRSAC